jgi:hypothetical protein
MRVLEIGGAPGTAAKEVAKRAGPSGHVLVIDRSAKGVPFSVPVRSRLAPQWIPLSGASSRVGERRGDVLDCGVEPSSGSCRS